MGDCGSLFVGFTIAAASVMCVSKSAALVGLTLPGLALGIPIFDTLVSMLRRYLERRSLFSPDRGHFHHRLIDLGLQQRHAVMIIYGATLVAAGLGLLMMVGNRAGSLIIVGAVALLILLLFRLVGLIRLRQTLIRLQEKYRYSRQTRNEQRVLDHLGIQFRQIHDVGQWRDAVYEAAQLMDFAWITLRTTHQDGRVEEESWRRQNAESDVSRLITMTIPIDNAQAGLSHQFEIAICTDGSYETAGRRASQFGRLMDEYAWPSMAPAS
jgi:UDP-GlcNAc:undecaprenyl-phosphate GlcNAc-1-phosphate transferase